MNWDTDFAGLPSIELRDGRKLETLADAANERFKANDQEGVAFEYPVIGELFDRMIRRPMP